MLCVVSPTCFCIPIVCSFSEARQRGEIRGMWEDEEVVVDCCECVYVHVCECACGEKHRRLVVI